MTTLLYTHPACLEHNPGPYHPESPERLRAILEALEAPEFARLERRAAPEAAIADLVRVHPRALVERLLAAVPETGHRGIDADTILSPASGRAAFRPEIVLISAGFDAHRSDPLAQLALDEGDYAWVTEQLLEIAGRHAEGRVVAALEGGYNLGALSSSVAAHLRVLMST